MKCTFHYIICRDIDENSVVRLYSKDYTADIKDFKRFFRNSQDVLEACSVEIDGEVYFWSRYSVVQNVSTGWEYIGKCAVYGWFNMNHTKALLASTIPSSYVSLNLDDVSHEYLMKHFERISINKKK